MADEDKAAVADTTSHGDRVDPKVVDTVSAIGN